MLSYWNKPKISGSPIESLETRRLLTGITYYLNSTGDDNNAGTSVSLPWKTIARADKQTYGPGDSLLLQGGATFTGNLTLGSADAGTAASPFTIGSYATGNATISAGSEDGITARDVGGIAISNLIITGSGPTTNTGSGIDLIDDQNNQPRIANININDVAVGKFGFVGIGIGSITLNTGFSDVTVSNSSVYDNAYSGLFSYAGAFTTNPAPYSLAHSNIMIDNVTAYDNTGYSGRNDSGNGIQLGNVNGATIEHCTAYNNGGDNSSTGGGPVGIWTYNSNDVVIEYNQSYSNEAAYIDGDGFDFDGGTTNSILQYNYSYDNSGAGYLEAQFADATPSTGNVIRYNISQNDGREHSQAGILLWAASSSDTINGTQIYGNTICLTNSSAKPTGILIQSATNNVTVRNNVFDVASGLKSVTVQSIGSGLVFQGNDYWTGSASAIGVQWGSNTYQTLSAWQSATGQEKNGSALTGLAVNPQVPVSGASGSSAFKISSTSPLVGEGIDLTSSGINPGATDFFGNALPSNALLAIGADQPPTVATGPLKFSSISAVSVYLEPVGALLDIWQNAATPGSGAPTSTAAISGISSVQVAGGAGSSLTINLSNGAWPTGVPVTFNGSSGSTVSIIGSSGTDTIQVSGSSLSVNSVSIGYSGLASINLNTGSSAATLTQTQQPASAVTLTGTGAETLVVQKGVFTFSGPITATDLTVDDESSVIFSAAKAGSGITTRQLAALNISAGAAAEVSPASAHANRLILVLGSLLLPNIGQLDLQNNDMLIHHGSLTQVTSLLANKSLESSVVNSDTTGTFAIGAILNTNLIGGPLYGSGTALGLFDGINAVSTDLLVKFTYIGDTNLDGIVDASDLSRVDNGYFQKLTGWANGDFNYDGTVNDSDYSLIDTAYMKQGARL